MKSRADVSTSELDKIAKVEQTYADYAERDFFHSNNGISKCPALCKYALACASALSFPCSISTTGSEGETQFFVVTL